MPEVSARQSQTLSWDGRCAHTRLQGVLMEHLSVPAGSNFEASVPALETHEIQKEGEDSAEGEENSRISLGVG